MGGNRVPFLQYVNVWDLSYVKGANMFRCCNFRNREVINIDTAERIGIVRDVDIDTLNGHIKAIIVKKHNSLVPDFFRGELIIPWENIVVMGEELVLVRVVNIVPKN